MIERAVMDIPITFPSASDFTSASAFPTLHLVCVLPVSSFLCTFKQSSGTIRADPLSCKQDIRAISSSVSDSPAGETGCIGGVQVLAIDPSFC
jgi:hypothetical protein